MNDSARLELRIHTGLHAGARALLPEQDECTVGSDPACDFVLADDGVAAAHLRLRRDESGAWQAENVGENVGNSGSDQAAVAPGRLLCLGPVVVSLAEADSAWPDAQSVAAAAQRADAIAGEGERANDSANINANASTEALTAASAAETPAAPAAPAAQPTAAAPTPRTPRLTPAARLAAAILLCLTALLGAALWWIGAQNVAAAPAPAAPSSDAAAQRAAIGKVLRDLGLEERATLRATPTGGWLVETAALADETLEELALALSRLDPKPGLRAASSADALGLVQDALLRLAGEEANLTATAAADGRVRIAGTMADAAARQALLDRLRAELPAWLPVDSGIDLREERAQRLLAELQAQYPGSISGEWSERQARLEIVARVAADDMARYEQTLVQAMRRYPAVPVLARLERLPASAPARLPFRVVAVVNGATDYVVLDDGGKLLLSGRRSGWQLVAVDAHEAVFENGRAARIRVPR